MIKGDIAKLVAIAEPNRELLNEAKKADASVPFYDDYNIMLDEQNPGIVWAFVENSRHLEIAKACATRKIPGSSPPGSSPATASARSSDSNPRQPRWIRPPIWPGRSRESSPRPRK